MDPNLVLYGDGEFLMAEFELDGDLVVNSDELQPGATVLVSNETDGIVSHEDLAKLFEVQSSIPIPTDEAVERTLADPALKQILQEADGKVDFDPEAEQEKLREFLSGVNSKKTVPEKGAALAEAVAQKPSRSSLLQPRPLVPQSTVFRFIKCSNCNGLFDTPSFQDHSCDYDSEQKPTIRAAAVQERKTSTPPRKAPSERIIVENQVRIRRYMKEELKYDLETGFDSSKSKKTNAKGPNECSICERKFVHTSGLVRHMEKHALDLIPTQTNIQQQNVAPSALGLLVVLKCDHCGRIFYDVKLALEHIYVHQFSTDLVKAEPVVEDAAVLKKQLKELMLEGEYLLALTAELSRISLKSEDEYFTTLVLSNVLQCEFCDFIFADVSFLLVHSATHVPERRFECTACDLRMTTAKEASIHYQTDCVYMREGLKQLQAQPNRFFVCNVCELKFANVELLQEHR